MRLHADPNAYCQAIDAYWEAATAHQWQDAATAAGSAITSCPAREEVPQWQDRRADAERKCKSVWQQAFGLVRRKA